MFKGKLFLVLLTVSLLAVAKAQASSSSFAVVGLGDGPEEIMIPGSLFPEAGLGSGFHLAYKFDVFRGGENHSGYITMVGGQRDVHFEQLNHTLGCCPVVGASLRTYTEDYSSSYGTFWPNYFNGWQEYINVLEMTYDMGGNGYSFMGYLRGSGSYPAIDASWYVIPTGSDSFVSALDLNTPDSQNWVVGVTIGDLTSPVPEPATYAMMLAGILFLWFFSGRRVAKHDPGGAIMA